MVLLSVPIGTLLKILIQTDQTNSDNLLTIISDTINVTIVPVNDAPIMVDPSTSNNVR